MTLKAMDIFNRANFVNALLHFPQHETLLTLTFESTFSYFRDIKLKFQSGVPAIQAQKDSGNKVTHLKSLIKNIAALASEGITDSFTFQDCSICLN